METHQRSKVAIYEIRAEQFVGKLEKAFYENEVAINAEYCTFAAPVLYSNRLSGEYSPIERHRTWGKNFQVAWFHVTGKIPTNWRGKAVALRINLQGELCIYDTAGVPLTGLTSTSVYFPNWLYDRFMVTDSAQGGEDIEYWIEASATKINGLDHDLDPDPKDRHRYGYYKSKLEMLDLAVFREDIWQLFFDANTLCHQMKFLPENSVRRARILRVLNLSADLFTTSFEDVQNARNELQDLLAAHAGESDLKTTAVGHAHLDTAWLWPVGETIRKCARTFSRQIKMIETYPEYIFGASQAQHYEWTRKYYPGLFKKIQEQVKKGRWEIQGCMWVEADCNLIGGESMVRQILHGVNFFVKEFDVKPRNLWLPDVFGYSAAMPQILRKSGVNYVVTQKLSWNQVNNFPHHTFIWRGIDGSEVITHFPPEDTYNSVLNPGRIMYARDNFAEKSFLPEFLTLFGLGDGGGGPAEDIIEMGYRQHNMEGCPQLEFGRAQDFLDRIGDYRDKLQRWDGELYLERHRGTLTTQAFIKKMNRKLELKLRELEFLYSMLPMADYPADDLDELWKTLLMNQFHDVLPGSSIHQVNEGTKKDYEEIEKKAEALREQVSQKLAKTDEKRLCLVNTLSHPFERPVVLPPKWQNGEFIDLNGQEIPAQREGDSMVILPRVEPLSHLQLIWQAKADKTTAEPVLTRSRCLENDMIRYEFSKNGTLCSIYDKETEQNIMVDSQEGNVLSLYKDNPIYTDAWDLDISYEKQLVAKAELTGFEGLYASSIRQGLKLEFTIGKSKIIQHIYLSKNSKRLDFETEVDWKERHRMLRVAFAVNVRADTASYDIQFGHIKRKTTNNTSWDVAQYEVCGHRYADLSCANYGVALLNDCKYGYKIKGNVIDLNLLRSPTYPDPKADRHVHQFTFALLPHKMDLLRSDVIAESAVLNQGITIMENAELGDFEFPVRLKSKQIILETLKRAEKGNSWVARLYETMGIPGTARLELSSKGWTASETDLIEDLEVPLKVIDQSVNLSFDPFEIKTMMLKPK